MAIYQWHGVTVPERIILQPETISAADITGEQDAEVRRVMVERFGADRYIRESGAKIISKDDWGTLYRAEMPNDEALVMVNVINATPEPDGSFHDYWIRVEPSVKTPLDAIAWTFDMDPKVYAQIGVQT